VERAQAEVQATAKTAAALKDALRAGHNASKRDDAAHGNRGLERINAQQ
jgi:hypothetical protein